MKRSQVNRIMQEADAFIRSCGFHLPPFAYWTPQDWAQKGPEAAEIAANRLGWDITDFGLGDYDHFGLFLFTVRNGNPQNIKTGRGKLYCEKLMIVGENQMTPYHFHWDKMEDIINRSGGRLAIQLNLSTPQGGLDESSSVVVSTDGVRRELSAGAVLELEEGESITLEAYCYHRFWGVGGRVLVGEVSLVNDDEGDNRFLEPIGRFPSIEEDEPPLYLLVGDYEGYYS